MVIIARFLAIFLCQILHRSAKRSFVFSSLLLCPLFRLGAGGAEAREATLETSIYTV